MGIRIVMKNNKHYVITIDEPCHEAWDNMNAVGCGRFCNSCNKVVHDLTNFSKEALQKWASEQKIPVCGRLNNDQLGESIRERSFVKKENLYRIAVSLLAITSLSSVWTVAAQKAPNSSFEAEQKPASLKPVSPIDDSSQFRVNGFISDSMSGKPLAGVSILINYKLMGVTDTTGRYSFILPVECRKPIVKITAEKIGSHQPVTDILRLKTLPAELNFILSTYECKSTVVITAGVLSIRAVDDKNKTVSKRKPWYRKMLDKRAGGQL